ncbi:MAG TPA: UDP-N-acetylglucosamine 1-carboxyvinyltransferase [Candidatus Faecousia excrementigallinarum]|uniref:UDP-N-acetylglucosamine 1-carboxyvinyltransferase n=1 Tax=Candidatus Faecousia excrementigallinarum TaxID=2840806 RepID=A0A9D1CLL6_9FIRM|nr:UDP-N-acetylglucosamine 1-carboxyvinyltransferase [Candidatus Faecousia excrementigallinarum]
MAKYEIIGGTPLEGSVTISGAKNAAVAILPAALLVDGVCRVENVPDISDVRILLEILRDMGVQIQEEGPGVLLLDASHITNRCPNPELVRKMRASYYLMGALLSRFHQADVALPGGCNFASRPIDQHVKGFAALGADVEETDDYVYLREGPDGLHGSRITLDVVSVGATINIIMAACLLPGQTIIYNAAREPHIVDLANFLNTMGARISGAGTEVVKIWGVDWLRGGSYAIIPDQIEAGTYLAAVAAVGGNVLVQNVIPKHMDCITSKLQEMGVSIINYDDAIRIRSTGKLHHTTVKTRPYPGFPTDMQAQICVCMTLASGISRLTENVYETRFFGYCTELQSMGANILITGKTATVTGTKQLTGATVCAHDLRAGAALIIAGLAAQGTTVVENIHFVERGYERLVEKLSALGAHIRRIDD